MSEQRAKKVREEEKGKERKNQRKRERRGSLFNRALWKVLWMASVCFSHTGHRRNVPPLEKGACSWIDSEAHFSLTKKHSCLYWSRTSASRETKSGEKNEGDKGRLGEKMKEEKGQTTVGKWENLRKVTEKRKKKIGDMKARLFHFFNKAVFGACYGQKKTQ